MRSHIGDPTDRSWPNAPIAGRDRNVRKRVHCCRWHREVQQQQVLDLGFCTYARAREACLADQISRHLDGAPVAFVLGAYSTFMPLRDPRSNEPLHLIGLEAYIPATPVGSCFQYLTAHNERNENGGMYAGGMYALRDRRGVGAWVR
jgi:hypothetical protein